MIIKKPIKMKQYLLVTLLVLIPIINYGQSEEAHKGFGFTINSSINEELYTARIVPSVVYTKGNNQFELGMGFNPSDRQIQKLLSSEFNYKYFPNGFNKKYNMYLITRVLFVNRKNKTFYPTAYNYLFVNGGYGFEVIPFKNAFIGTNVCLGTFTFSKKTEILYDAVSSQNLFDEIGLNLAFQLNVGYRF